MAVVMFLRDDQTDLSRLLHSHNRRTISYSRMVPGHA
jgi:hypothetical protein